MKSANLLGGSEAREALMKLETLILSSRGEDAVLNQAILDSTESENIVDILVGLKSRMEARETPDAGAEAAAAIAVLGTDAEVARDAGDPRMDPDGPSKEEAEVL